MRKHRANEIMTNRDDRSVSLYLNELTGIKLLNGTTESEIAKNVRRGDPDAIRTLISANLRFVVTVAKQYQNHGLPLADLISEGNLGLIQAARKFEPERGFKFISYAVWWIKQSIVAALLEHKQLIRLPVEVHNIKNRIKKATIKFECEHARQPTIGELNELVPVKNKRLKDVIQSPGYAITSAYDPEEGMLINQTDLTADPEPLQDEKIDNDEFRTKAEAALRQLPDRDRKIIEMAFGLNGQTEKCNLDIAAEAGLSTEMVRYILNRSIKQFRSYFALATSST